MKMLKRVVIAVVLIGLSLGAIYVVMARYSGTTASEKTFQELQDELNKEKHKKKVISRFEVKAGLSGLNIEDISLTLLDYSYHYLNDSGRRQPFVTVKCLIDIRKFEKDAEKLGEHLESTGMHAPVNIQLPDSERLILGLLDDEKDEFITLAALPRAVVPVIKFAELRKKQPEFMIITLEPDETCTKCDQYDALNTTVFGFDRRNKSFYKALEVKTYRSVDVQDDLSAGSGYKDKASVSWSDWINDEYRELIISTEREIQGQEDGSQNKAAFRNTKEIYGWINDKELVLIERIVDGQSIINRRGSPLLSGLEVTLKGGELYETSKKGTSSKITSTNGKISSYLLSPDKRYVAYSVIVGSYEIVPLEGEGEQRPVRHIMIMDLDQKKQLIEIKPQSESQPFIYADRWISTEELILTEADGFATGYRYIYHAGDNELRLAEPEEMNL